MLSVVWWFFGKMLKLVEKFRGICTKLLEGNILAVIKNLIFSFFFSKIPFCTHCCSHQASSSPQGIRVKSSMNNRYMINLLLFVFCIALVFCIWHFATWGRCAILFDILMFFGGILKKERFFPSLWFSKCDYRAITAFAFVNTYCMYKFLSVFLTYFLACKMNRWILSL